MEVFSKFLKKTDVTGRLSVPSKSLKNLPSFEGRHVVDLPVKDSGGSTWMFRCHIRKKGGHRKPVLSGAWHRFAVTKGLGIGDEIIFFKEFDQATGAMHYRVRVKKLVNNFRLFGVSIKQYAPAIVL